MTRKEFVLNIVEELKANPRAVLAGHGIQAAVLQELIARPDVLAKLASVLYSTVYAKKGAAGLKKQSNFKISGYKNFPEFNMKAREDVEIFVGGLSTEDASVFTNANNILTILLLPQQAEVTDTNVETLIIAGKSVALTFDSSVKKEFKIPGGIYITIMLGDSAARPAEEATAKRTEKINKKKQVRRTPDKIKAELKAKATKKLAALNVAKKGLDELALNTAAELEQYNALGAELGATATGASRVFGAVNANNAFAENIKTAIANLSPDEKAAYKYAVKALKSGDKKRAGMWLKEISDQNVVTYLKGGMVSGAKPVIDARKQALQDGLIKLAERAEMLLSQLEIETDNNKKLSIRSMISKNNAKVKEYRAKLGTYKNFSFKAMNKKAQMLKETHALIEQNIAKGINISQALNLALASLDAKAAEKVIIKQQIMQQVGEGMPMQYAVQQAIQSTIQEVPVAATAGQATLSGNADIEDLLAML